MVLFGDHLSQVGFGLMMDGFGGHIIQESGG